MGTAPVRQRNIILGAAMAWAIGLISPAVAAERPALADLPSIASEQGVFSGTLTAEETGAVVPGFGRIEGLQLYGFAPGTTGTATPSLAPAVWAVKPGDILDFTLRDELACNNQRPEGTGGAVMSQTNVHTHGLIVSPAAPQNGVAGDYVLILANTDHKPAGTTPCQPAQQHRGMETFEGSIKYHIPIPKDHPAGLYWYHAHAHGVSQQQIARGLSGLITIGDLWDYTALTCDPDDQASPIHCKDQAAVNHEKELRTLTDAHFIMLKDIQVEKHKDGTWHTVKWYDAGFCSNNSYSELKDGACSPAGNNRQKWLVTVNGQLQPKLTSADNHSQILRIANISASMSYNLELRAGGKLIPFQYIANDGVHTGQDKEKRILGHGRILLMPSARVEIYIDRGDVCQALGADCNGRDINAGLDVVKWACPDGDPLSCADPWPIGRIMDITFEKLDSGEKPRPLDVDTSPLSNQLAVPDHNVVAAGLCSDGRAPEPPLPSGTHRVIGLWNGTIGKDELFTMMTDPTPSTAMPDIKVPAKVSKAWLKQMGFLPFDHNRTNLCVTAGGVETWVVFNAADEYHNFHVHQSKFSVLEINAGVGPGRAIGSTVLHDNFPIPPKGWIKIQVRFSNEVAGRFVYHCHILEHEDKGMMSIMEVVAQKTP